MIPVKIKLNGGIMPKKATHGAAAFDLYAPEDVEIKGGRQILDMGFSVETPHGYAATIQPRSGFSAKGIEVKVRSEDGTWIDYRLDSDVKRGLIDEDYRGNVGVILMTREYVHATTILKKGTRIAQMQIVEVPQVELIEVDELSQTDRGEGGFGSTGSK